MRFALKPQEIPFDSPESDNMFDLVTEKRVVATQAVVALLEGDLSAAGQLVTELNEMALKYRGLDYLQVFENDDGENIWIIEDGEAITVMTPSDY